MDKDTKNIIGTFVLLVALFLVMMLAMMGCSPYKKIAGKANPTEKERTLLAIACSREFPVIKNTYNIDSVIKATQKDYTKQIDSLTDVADKLDSIIHEQIPIIDTAFVDSSNCIPRIKIAYQEIQRLSNQRNVLQASIYHLKNQLIQFKKEYQPCDSLRIQTAVRAECDSAMMQKLHDATKATETKNIILSTKLEDKTKTSRNWMWTAIALGVLLITGIVLSIKKKFSKPLG